jgi:hypothetical protein
MCTDKRTRWLAALNDILNVRIGGLHPHPPVILNLQLSAFRLQVFHIAPRDVVLRRPIILQ